MISFEILTKENKESIRNSLYSLGEGESVDEIVDAFYSLTEEGTEVAFASALGCILVRLCDEGRYFFVYPLDVSEDADIEKTLPLIAEYARRELIPLYFTDVPYEEIKRVEKVFPITEAQPHSDDGEFYVVSVRSECDEIGNLIIHNGEGVSLTNLIESDIPEYARLCRDDEVNRYWGYDYKSEVTDVPDEYFLRVAETEHRTGVALTLAVREPCEDALGYGRFIGEAVLFDFDYQGGCMLALRLLPEYQGKGYARRALEALFGVADGMGVKLLRAKVLLANERSLKFFDSTDMTRMPDDDGKAVYEFNMLWY